MTEGERYTKIPNSFIDNTDLKLTPVAKLVFIILCRHCDYSTGTCWPSMARIAELAGCTIPTARRAVGELCKSGIVQTEQRRNGKRESTSHLYRVIGRKNLSTSGDQDVSGEVEKIFPPGRKNLSTEVEKIFPPGRKILSTNSNQLTELNEQEPEKKEPPSKKALSQNTNKGPGSGGKSSSCQAKVINLKPFSATTTAEESTILDVLRRVEGYQVDLSKDLPLLRDLTSENPEIDLLQEIKAWRTYKLDHPLDKKSSPRSQIRNWIRNAKKYKQEREERTKKEGERNGESSKYRYKDEAPIPCIEAY